jgi:hypothetical protein
LSRIDQFYSRAAQAANDRLGNLSDGRTLLLATSAQQNSLIKLDVGAAVNMLPVTTARLLHSHCNDGCEAIVIKEGRRRCLDPIYSRRCPLLQVIQDFGSGSQSMLELRNF